MIRSQREVFLIDFCIRLDLCFSNTLHFQEMEDLSGVHCFQLQTGLDLFDAGPHFVI